MRLNKWKYLFKSYFNYTVKEQRAIIVLLFIIGFLQLSLAVLHFIPVNGKSNNDVVEDSTSNIISEEKTINHERRNTDKVNCTINLKKFNPNTNTMSDWVSLGLSEKQASSIIKYVNKGGAFKIKRDLKKMHVVNDSLFQMWENYIQLPEEDQDTEKTQKEYKPIAKEKVLLNINIATTAELDKLPLIGEGRAKAIVSYRDRLGGFISIDQLTELKSLPDSVLQVINPFIKTDGLVLRHININSDTLIHPYLPKPLAKMIVIYRQQHGNYQRIDDLRILPLYDEKIMRKIAPYLIVKP